VATETQPLEHRAPRLLIVEELAYLPMPGDVASHLFQVISRRYEHGSIVLTTNPGIATGATSSRKPPSPPPSSTVS
jgi:DNA replication protein DnaC